MDLGMWVCMCVCLYALWGNGIKTTVNKISGYVFLKSKGSIWEGLKGEKGREN